MQITVFSRYVPRSGTAESYRTSTFGFLRNFHTVLCSGCTNLPFHEQWRWVPFPPLSPAFTVSRLSDDGHPDECKVIPPCSVDLHFSNSDAERLFCASCLSVCLLWGNIYIDLLPVFLIGLFIVSILSYRSCLCILETNPVSVILFASLSSHPVGCLHLLRFPFLCRSF